MSMHEVRGQFQGTCGLQKARWICTRSEVGIFRWRSKRNWRSHMHKNWPLTLMQTHRVLTGWRHSQINFKSVLIFIDLAQLHFCLDHKTSHWAFIDRHTPVILQLGEDKILSYLSKREFWANTSYFLM